MAMIPCRCGGRKKCPACQGTGYRSAQYTSAEITNSYNAFILSNSEKIKTTQPKSKRNMKRQKSKCPICGAMKANVKAHMRVMHGINE